MMKNALAWVAVLVAVVSPTCPGQAETVIETVQGEGFTARCITPEKETYGVNFYQATTEGGASDVANVDAYRVNTAATAETRYGFYDAAGKRGGLLPG